MTKLSVTIFIYFSASNYKIIFESFFKFLVDNKYVDTSFTDWQVEVDVNCVCYDESYSDISVLHCAELLSKNELVEFGDDVEYDSWKDKLFLQISQFFLSSQ